MDLAIQTQPVGGSLEEKLAYAGELCVDGVNLGTYSHYFPSEIDPGEYVEDASKREELRSLLDRHDLELYMLGAGNNPLHPDPERAEACDRELRETIRLAAEMGVEVVSGHSGLPGASPDDVSPNWITTRVPPEPHLDEAIRYQWEEVALPYWRELADFADDHGVDLAIEPHLNTLVYTPGQLLRLREETNDRVGAKLDPAHLFLQGIDELEGIRALGEAGAIHSFEASDAVIFESRRREKGVLDVAPLDARLERSWEFRAPGNGHGEDYWRELVAALEMVGYDGAISIQHLNSPTELRSGFEKSVALFREIFGDT